MDAFGLGPQDCLGPRPSPFSVSQHLYLINDCHIVLIVERCGLYGAADEIEVLELLLLPSDQRAIL